MPSMPAGSPAAVSPAAVSLAAGAAAPTPEQVAALRGFSRFYTRRLGVLHEHLLDTRFTLPESRVLWELAHHDGVSAAALARELDLDPGYLSRLLAGLRARGLLKGQPDAADRRQTLLRLSAAGRRAFAPLERRADGATASMLAALPPARREQLVDAVDVVTRLLAPADAGDEAALRLRPPRSGDLGWVVARHGALYAQEFGWSGLAFEALVARLCALFVQRFDAAREACWIAEQGGRPLGCVFVVQARGDDDAPDPGVAQLRMLLVEPEARGHGLGDRLVAECTRFATQAGYTRLRLWTNDMLSAARRLYERHGYRRVSSAPHAEFGIPMVGEVWERSLP